ncbi:signal peptidase I [Tumebacillus avium]|uniref:Signal peptidase I n=1 Tax=Tumebacillus avium TaxID=1903704 RepID=A0A1Y0IL08_9BACL|nr:signal peptidase I [Tumebacillus avium]ARU61187.1 signal peptidase I [Tumebacillus avium]
MINMKKGGMWLGGGLLLLAAAALLIVFLPERAPAPDQASVIAIDPSKPPVTDPDTKTAVPVVKELDDSMVLYEYGHDAMDRGDYEYMQHPLVVDQDFTTAKTLTRGDVVAFTTPEEGLKLNPYLSRDPRYKDLARVVALPGETVEVKDAQIYINGAKLDTFYGAYHRRGADFDTYAAQGNFSPGPPKKSDQKYPAVRLASHQVFVVADDWFRGIDSTAFGPLDEKDLYGKVLGYKN